MTTRKPIVPGAFDAYPVLPLRDIVVFPHMIVPLFVGREKVQSSALDRGDAATASAILLVDAEACRRRPIPAGTGAICTTPARSRSILQLLKLPDGTVKVLVEGAQRAPRSDAIDRRPRAYLISEFEPLPIADDAIRPATRPTR